MGRSGNLKQDYLFLGLMWLTYLGSWMTTCLGKSCSLGLPRVPFVHCCQFMYLVISLLVLRAGYGIWLYQFPIIAYLFTLNVKKLQIAVTPSKCHGIFPNAKKVILTASPISTLNFEALAQTVFEISCQQGKNAENFKTPSIFYKLCSKVNQII